MNALISQTNSNFVDALMLAMLGDDDIDELDVMPLDPLSDTTCVRIQWLWRDDGASLERFIFIHDSGTVTWATQHTPSVAKPIPEWFRREVFATASAAESIRHSQ